MPSKLPWCTLPKRGIYSEVHFAVRREREGKAIDGQR
jgi:hypothetical protein